VMLRDPRLGLWNQAGANGLIVQCPCSPIATVS
jgi:hypothetical protein